ncbi:hypothetical protein VNI00_002495 [Paramarasmius palmivorus]|uniref:Uncharacterized protein n=1 Tax=Paramarasmius palmivorus TaxID=297713 RepID=A0AAW0DWT1_9AGAR
MPSKRPRLPALSPSPPPSLDAPVPSSGRSVGLDLTMDADEISLGVSDTEEGDSDIEESELEENELEDSELEESELEEGELEEERDEDDERDEEDSSSDDEDTNSDYASRNPDTGYLVFDSLASGYILNPQCRNMYSSVQLVVFRRIDAVWVSIRPYGAPVPILFVRGQDGYFDHARLEWTVRLASQPYFREGSAPAPADELRLRLAARDYEVFQSVINLFRFSLV